MNYSRILWDWNGTLLDDASYCIDVINVSLKKRGLPLLDRARYTEIFRFPVIEYYKDLGFDFDKESYEVLAVEFVDNYMRNASKLKLFPEVKEVLAVFAGKGIKQYVLSASEKTGLCASLDSYGISKYFSDVAACGDIYAGGKIEIGKKFLSSLDVTDGKTLMVGDSLHDYETAQAIGADCILVSCGHGDGEKLKQTGVPVISSLHGLYPYVLGTTGGAKIPPLRNPATDERRSFDLTESQPKTFRSTYKDFYDDVKNTNKTEDW